MDDLPIYCLSVWHSGGNTTNVYGSKRSLKLCVDAWTENLSLTFIEVVGYCNSPDRAELICMFERESVTAMSLWRHS